MFGECHIPCMLKASCRFRKKISALEPLQKTKYFVSTQVYILFQWQSKVVNPIDPTLSSFLYISVWLLYINVLVLILIPGDLHQCFENIHDRGVEIRKCCACPRASYLKNVTCLDKILFVLFLFKHSIFANTIAGS